MEEVEETEKTAKKENTINSLCKEYFTWELCDEPVTDTRSTLKNKLWVELLKYGDNYYKKYFPNNEYLLSDCVATTILECWKNWRKKPYDSYLGYFSLALRNNALKIISKEPPEKPKYLSERMDADSPELGDMIEEKRNPSEDELIDKIENRNNNFKAEQTEKVLKCLEKFIRASVSQAKKGREIMLTYKLLDSMKLDKPDWFLEQKKKHDFINIELVNDYYKKKSDAESQNKEFTYTQKEDVAEMFIIEKCTKSTDKKAVAATISRINGNINDFIESLKQHPYYTF